ncbi:MAG: Lrp/AsnC family transcriptional regulator [Candidatus Bathyarchaeia archaeon]
MDNLDQQIIYELTGDAQKPFRAIAKKLGVSTQTVIRRYNKMKANGTIRLCAIRVNLEKLGYKGTAHLLINIDPESNTAKTVEQLREIPNVIIATRTIGTYEAYAVLAFRDTTDMVEGILKIKELPNVQGLVVNLAIPGIRVFPPSSK